jgi:hypothetical protein
MKQSCQVTQTRGGIGVILAVSVRPYFDSAAIEFLGCGQLALVLIQACEIIRSGCYLRML